MAGAGRAVAFSGITVAASLMERAIGSEAFTALQRELGAVAEYRMTEQQADEVVAILAPVVKAFLAE